MKPAWRGLGVVLLGLLLSVYAWWPMLTSYPNVQGGDGPFSQHWFEVAWASWRRYHELPLWNPYQCGGVPFWDNPQSFAASPIMWALMPFGSTRGMELWIIIHLVLTFVSMWLFARSELAVSVPAGIFAACTWTFCGYYNQHLSGGHITWCTFGYFPLAIYFWRRAERDARFAVAMGILTTWEMFEGGADALPHLAALLAAETLTRAWPPRRVLAIARAAAIVLLVFFTLSACRTLPVIDQLHAHPTRTLVPETDALQWTTLQEMFLARTHSRGVAGQQYVWPEYDAYVGPFVLALAFVGLVAGGASRAWVVALLLYAFAMMLGHAGRLAPWSIVKAHVYPFTQMRVPSRFNAEVTLFVAALAAIGLDRVSASAKKKFRNVRVHESMRVVAFVLAFIAVGDMIAVGIQWVGTCFTGAPSDPHLVVSPRLYVAQAGIGQFIDQPRQGLARQQCWEEWAFHTDAPVWVGDVPQARALDASVATVSGVSRTQNTFTFDVEASAPTRILMNGGYDAGWGASVGTAVLHDNGLLGVDVPAGSHHVKVKYWPAKLTLGLWLSGLSLIGIVVFFVMDARRRRRGAVPTPSPKAD